MMSIVPIPLGSVVDTPEGAGVLRAWDPAGVYMVRLHCGSLVAVPVDGVSMLHAPEADTNACDDHRRHVARLCRDASAELLAKQASSPAMGQLATALRRFLREVRG